MGESTQAGFGLPQMGREQADSPFQALPATPSTTEAAVRGANFLAEEAAKRMRTGETAPAGFRPPQLGGSETGTVGTPQPETQAPERLAQNGADFIAAAAAKRIRES